MAFGKHAFKVIAVFAVLFLVGLILKLLGLFDDNSLENFEGHENNASNANAIPGYSTSMNENEFREFVNKATQGNNEKLKNIPSDKLELLSGPHQEIIKNMINELN